MEAFFFAAKDVRRLFIHVHHIISLDDVEMHVGKVELGEFRFYLGGIPHKEDVQVMKPGGIDGARNDHGGAKIPPHGINGYDGARVIDSASVLAITDGPCKRRSWGTRYGARWARRRSSR